MASDQNNPERLDQEITNHLSEHLLTSTPAVITEVSEFNSQQVVTVRPLINKRYPDAVSLIPPEIYKVPVVFPSAGGGLLSFPVQKGDTVLLVFTKDNIQEWLVGDGAQQTPDTLGIWDMTDAVAIPGLYTTKTNLGPNPTDVELKFAGSSVKLQPNGDVSVSAAGNLNASSGAATVVDAGTNLTATAGGDVMTNSGANTTIVSTGNISLVSGGAINLTAVSSISLSAPTMTQDGVNIGNSHTHNITSGSSAPGPTAGPQ